MYMIVEVSQYVAVASFSEAWIEITVSDATAIAVILSPPSRRRGLKFTSGRLNAYLADVASFSEAWIEISRRPAQAP